MVAAVLAGFPPAMVAVISLTGRSIPITDLLIISLVGIVAMLAQLLWATPNVYSELEGKSWIFIASRPRGRIALFLGKYLSAVAFSLLVCLVAISLCLAIRTYVPPATMVNPLPAWAGMMGTALVGCVVYSAVFSLIGTIFQKRAMVFGAAYVILFEIMMANIPAIISQFTVRFHLQAIAADWIGWYLPISPAEFASVYGSYSTRFHLICLAGVAMVTLIAGSVTITARQYITAEEN
jgi:hypothetical protein